MATKRNSRRSSKVGIAQLGKPRGVIEARVQAVGPERFGIVAVDPHKVSSKWMLCDFYGKVLLPPRVVEHGRAQLRLATQELREACEQHHLQALAGFPEVLQISIGKHIRFRDDDCVALPPA